MSTTISFMGLGKRILRNTPFKHLSTTGDCSVELINVDEVTFPLALIFS